MAIPPGSLQTEFDFQNPACFTNGGTAITDLSGNGNNFTLNNTAYTYDGTYGSILFPSGTYADGTPSDYAFGTAAFSILAWVKFNTSVPGINISHFGGDSTGERTYFYWRSSDNFIVSDNAGSAGGWVQAADNQWHLLALTRPASGTVGDQEAYIDGVLITNNPANFYNGSATLNATSGVARLHSTVYGATGDLELATFDVYTAELSAGDILTYYNDTYTRFIPPPTPTVEYDFQNGSYSGSGTTITDLQGGDTNLTIGNGHWVSGTPNYFDLQGDTNLFNTSPGSSFSSTTFTVNCWYNPLYTNPGTYASVWGLGKDGNPTSPILSTNSDGTLNIQWSFGYGLVGTTVTNGWHLISFVSNGSTTTLYVDGISIGSAASSSGTVASPYTIRLGSSSNSSNAPISYAYGKIGYWSYFDVALDAAEVLDLYNATSGSYAPAPPPSSNGVGGRQFAQGFNG